jgi:hypothetical protein
LETGDSTYKPVRIAEDALADHVPNSTTLGRFRLEFKRHSK